MQPILTRSQKKHNPRLQGDYFGAVVVINHDRAHVLPGLLVPSAQERGVEQLPIVRFVYHFALHVNLNESGLATCMFRPMRLPWATPST